MKQPNIHTCEQGSNEWKELRAKHFTASDCAAMMNESKYKSRNQLLAEKATGVIPEVSEFQQSIFDKGHKAEAAARELIEMENLMEFPPVVGSIEIEGLPLLASLDGMELHDKEVIFEHKLWGDVLAENVRNGVLEPSYYWQLEHQLLVFGAQSVLFVVSDGTASKRETMIYRSQPERREALIAGWKQFKADLENYQPEAKVEAVVAKSATAFPLVTFQVQGTDIVSNINEILPAIQERAAQEMARTLETDQDFADKEQLNKETKKARAKLKEVVDNVQGQFVSFAEFSETAKQIDAVLQKMQSQGEKQVKQAKEEKKDKIVHDAITEIADYVDDAGKKVKPIDITLLNLPRLDFVAAMKNKRTLESLQNAADSVVAETKIEIDKIMAKIVPNQIYLREHAKDYTFLFNDAAQIINQDTEPFQAIVKSRILDHKAAEEKRLETEREQIRLEEERKAKSKVEAEQKAEQLALDDAKRLEEAKAARDEEDHKEEAGTIAKRGQAKEEEPQPKSTKKIVENVTPSFASDVTYWAAKWNLSLEATTELSVILKNHGML